MRATRGRSTSTTRAMALALALTIPLLAACDDHAGLPELSGAAGELQELVGASAQEPSGDSPAHAAARVLDAPGGVAVNQGVRYVADTGHQRVLRFSAEGTCVVVAGPAAPDDSLAWCTADPSGQPVPNTQPLLQHPTAIAVDRHGDVFVADPQASRIFVVDGRTRAFSTVVGTGERGAPVSGALAVESPLSTPTALAVTRDGSQLYIADSSAHQVLSVDVSAMTSTDGPGPLLDEPPVPRMVLPAPSATSSAPTPSGTGSPSPATTSSSSPTSTGSPTGSATPDDASTDDDASFTPAERELAVRVQAVPGDDEEQDAADDASGTTGDDEQAGEPTGGLPRTDTEDDGDSSTPQDAPLGGQGETEPGDSPSAAPSTQGRLFVVAGPGCAPTADGRPALDATVPALTAGLSSPSALALVEGIESMPELYVADSANRQIYSVSDGAPDVARELTTVASDDPALAHLGAIAVVNSMGEKFVVTDTSTGELLTAPVWEESRTWTVLSDRLDAPSALAADRSSVLVTDSDADGLYGIAVGDGSERSPEDASPGSEEDAEPRRGGVELLSASTPLAADDRAAAPAAAAACAPSPAPATTTSDRDRDLTPQSTPSSSRPRVPGNAVVPDPGTHRFSGNDRVATSVDTSQKLFPKAGSVPVVVISSASSYADSAGGARYAAEKGGSLLLTPGSRLDPAVEAEVRRSLAAGGSIVVTGREDAIAPSVFSALEAIAPGRTERIGGVDRYETATKLAQRLADQMTTTSTGPIYLVTGANYPDALVVVSLARRTGGLVVLSKDGVLPPVTRTLLQQMDPTGARTVPVGGAAAEAAASLGGEAGRTAAAAAVVGSDRYETARKVAERFVALDAAAGARTDVVGLATGTTWPDALVGSTAMGTLVGPLLLNHGDQLDPNVVKALAAIPSSRPSTTVVFGGEKAVPASVMAAFGAAAKG